MRRAGRPPTASTALPSAPALQPQDMRLMLRLRGDLSLSERPFADLGAELGMDEDEVIGRLHLLLGQGVLKRFGPIFPAEWDPKVPLSAFDHALVDATRSGLPLVQRPYEALGAMLGVASEAVRVHLAGMRARGLLCRVGAVLDEQHDGRCPP